MTMMTVDPVNPKVLALTRTTITATGTMTDRTLTRTSGTTAPALSALGIGTIMKGVKTGRRKARIHHGLVRYGIVCEGLKMRTAIT